MNSRIKIVLLINIALFCAVIFLRPAYAEEPIDPYKVKAGYLFNFTKFITWADNSTETFNICIVGNDPFGSLIDPIQQRSAFNLPIKLFRIEHPNQIPNCHIIYFSKNTRPLKSNNTLTVGEGGDFIKQGGMIAFIERDNKIKLQINLKLLQENNLKISAKLLEVSEVTGGNND